MLKPFDVAMVSLALDHLLMLLRQGGDPFGLEKHIERGGSLDEALGLPMPREARRNSLIRDLYARCGREAYKTYRTYRTDVWPRTRAIMEGCPHEKGSVEYLCWQIFDLHPKLLGERHFDNITKRDYGKYPASTFPRASFL